MEDFNKFMSVVWIFVEWFFGDIVSIYKFIDYKKNFKVVLSLVGKMYIVVVILRNVLICLYGNFIFSFFDFSFLSF